MKSIIHSFKFLSLALMVSGQFALGQTHNVFAFIGKGIWSITSNGLNNKKSSGLLPKGDTIYNSTAPDDTCCLNLPQYLAEGTIHVMDDYASFLMGDMLLSVPSESIFTNQSDSKVYPIKKYGIKVWMTANLNYNQTGSKVYKKYNPNTTIYGRLYTKDQANAAVPAGWYLPSRAEWNELMAFLGGAGPMKDTMYWLSPDAGAPNTTGFNARPGGYFWTNSFEYLPTMGFGGQPLSIVTWVLRLGLTIRRQGTIPRLEVQNFID